MDGVRRDFGQGCPTPDERGQGEPFSSATVEFKDGKAHIRTCFTAGTIVHTKDGTKVIEEIHIGDVVLSWNEKTGENSFHKVVKTFQREVNSTKVILYNDGSSIETTDEHPFYIKNKGWVSASNLVEGDLSVLSTNDSLKIISVTNKENIVTVYNFEVETSHTYFVGEQGILVHNECIFPNLKNRQHVESIKKIEDNNSEIKELLTGINAEKGENYNDFLKDPDSFIATYGTKLTEQEIRVLKEEINFRRITNKLNSDGISFNRNDVASVDLGYSNGVHSLDNKNNLPIIRFPSKNGGVIDQSNPEDILFYKGLVTSLFKYGVKSFPKMVGKETVVTAENAGKFVASKVGTEAAKTDTKLLNPAINITENGLAHALDRHTVNGIAKWANKSKFFNASEVKSLIQQGTQMPMVKQANGNFSRIVNAGRNIGIDRATGNPTSIYTIITNGQGNLITAFPGIP